MLITLNDAKTYLRVDFDDEDTLISGCLRTAEALSVDVGRLSDEQWDKVNADPTEEDSAELKRVRAVMQQAILFTVGYLYEHREEADMHDMAINVLRPLLYAVREGVSI